VVVNYETIVSRIVRNSVRPAVYASDIRRTQSDCDYMVRNVAKNDLALFFIFYVFVPRTLTERNQAGGSGRTFRTGVPPNEQFSVSERFSHSVKV